ncbi:nodulation protein NfeD [Paludibacter sp. 221]|uniref:NfeD family protein n=1 Tax=Paludibacter sp. 221 TaxID=2302939 RepID=UPI0013D0D58B|nr:NfeD family protein [Paludibacter sp. 221]NDV46710.1 nodulation protein NfeD [Paludibacter sp. 221]
MRATYIFLTTLALFFSFLLHAQENTSTLFKINLQKDIGGTTWIYIQKGFEKALEDESDAILIHMNTYGGEVLYADSIRTKILNSHLPVYVFIDNNAASAGALIALACDKIYMRQSATIGAASVVNQSGEKMPDKYQSYMRATMRATAESHGKKTTVSGADTVYTWIRDPLIAEAMVDERTVVPGISEEGKILTFSAREAIEHGYCDGIAENLNQVIEEYLGYENYEIVSFEPTFWDEIKGFFLSSVIQGILIMLIIGGIYFELQTPGVGFPLIVAITAAALYFVPLYIDGLAANWEILLFIIGIGLIVLELFVIPGFGIAGISGIVLVIAGLTLSLLENVNFNFAPVQTGSLGTALITVSAGLLLGFAIVIYLSTKIGSKGMFRKIALNTTLDNESGYIAVPMEEKNLLGKTGITTTVLRPSGKVEIEGKMYDAVSEQSFIEKGTPVRVTRYETGQVYVEVRSEE